MPLSPSPHNGSERRRFARYDMALDVAFAPLCRGQAQPTDEQLSRTVTVNLSLGGLCLYAETSYPIGSSCFCALSLPGRLAPLNVVGTVAWFRKIDQDAHGYKLGVEFNALSAHDQAVLRTFLEHPPTAEASSAKKRLLLVDDDEELRRAMELRFAASGFQVITAGDGLEALRKGREDHPDLIILDLMLPQLNGYEVCRLLKFDQKFRHIPVILCSARSRQDDKAMGQAVGADAYVTKPFDGKTLIATAEELIAARPR